jgi:hypothetical protein
MWSHFCGDIYRTPPARDIQTLERRAADFVNAILPHAAAMQRDEAIAMVVGMFRPASSDPARPTDSETGKASGSAKEGF